MTEELMSNDATLAVSPLPTVSGGFQLLGQTSLLKPGECGRDHLQAREPSGRQGDAVEGDVVAGFFAHGSLLLRVGADDNTLSAPDSTVTLITLDAAASPMIDRLLRACATGYGCRALINVKTLNGIKPDWPAIARGKE